jgi:hypothetical protein
VAWVCASAPVVSGCCAACQRARASRTRARAATRRNHRCHSPFAACTAGARAVHARTHGASCRVRPHGTEPRFDAHCLRRRPPLRALPLRADRRPATLSFVYSNGDSPHTIVCYRCTASVRSNVWAQPLLDVALGLSASDRVAALKALLAAVASAAAAAEASGSGGCGGAAAIYTAAAVLARDERVRLCAQGCERELRRVRQ